MMIKMDLTSALLSDPVLTFDGLAEGRLPGVHLDELDVGQNLVHLLDPVVDHLDALDADLGDEATRAHLRYRETQRGRG